MLGVLRAHRPQVDLPDDLPLILADAVLLEQVVVNILDNAAKHAPDGTEIFVSPVKRCIGAEMAILDLGPGTLPEDQGRVFDMRLDSHCSRLVTQDMILKTLWEPAHSEDSQYVRVYIRQMHQKLGNDAANPRLSFTEPGVK